MSVHYVTRHEPPRVEGAWPSPPDPGDLSKRVAGRRTELGLSQVQLAARAGISLRYLEYLERYPAQPTATTLRRLAAALVTTPGALLGGGADTPPGRARPPAHPVVSRITPVECCALIAPGGVGRIGFGTMSGPVVLPVNFAVVDGTIVIRTGEGTIIDGHGDEHVAFEVDRIDEALCRGWSVLVRGQAHRVTHPAELRRVQEEAAILPWVGPGRDAYLRIIPDRVTGRRIS